MRGGLRGLCMRGGLRGGRALGGAAPPFPPGAPAEAAVLGAVAVMQGFTVESSWMVQLTAVHLAVAGFAVAVLDHQGHLLLPACG